LFLKTAMTDADMGAWQYRYNVFGELIWQQDAKSQQKGSCFTFYLDHLKGPV
jgi:YD repeat-containing protein